MHDFAELIFHAIIGLLRALWAICEFVLQCLGEAASDGLFEAIFGSGSDKRQKAKVER